MGGTAPPRLQLGALLVRAGALTTEQLELALAEKEETGRRIGEILVEHGWVEPEAIAKALAQQHGLEYVDFADTIVEPAAVSILPERLARRYDALPVRFLEDNAVLVAVADPTDLFASDDLRLALGLNVRLAVAAEAELRVAIARAYRITLDIDEAEPGEAAEEDPASLEDLEDVTPNSPPAIRLVHSLIAKALSEGASDLHFEPQAAELVVRARVDGVTRRFTTISRSLQAAVVGRLKIMGDLDIAERRAPQDGRLSIRSGGRSIDLRVAVLPTTHGEQIVIRLPRSDDKPLGLAELGMSPEHERVFSRAIREPYGSILSCGPTGSGKTTTLYAALDLLNEEERVLMTIEDPVEHRKLGINQIEVNAKAGLTFARGLRTMLRSDPDVILVGEIRDEETARIAIQAAMTGHLVLSTLHTHNAVGSIARLGDMGVEPSLLATAVNLIVAQRLARRLCPKCREEYVPGEAEVAELGIASAGPGATLFRAVGCIHCGATGYAGRVALYELMEMRGELPRLVGTAGPTELFEAAVAQGMTTLRQDGIRLCLAGVTSPEEVRRVAGDRLD
jgi:type IV pilus assembly protein PilB